MNRTDPSSISFGRRLAFAEATADAAYSKVKELEKNAPTRSEKQNAQELKRYRKAEKLRASQLLASDASIEELQSLDRSVLTTAHSFLIDERVKQSQFLDVLPPAFVFDEAAQERMRNWAALAPKNPAAVWANNNTVAWATPASHFERWTMNQNTPENKRLKQERTDKELQHGLTQSHDAQMKALAPKPQGSAFGSSSLGRHRSGDLYNS